MFGLNPWEIGMVFLVIVLLFGAKRVPEVARSLGRGIREFKSSVEGKDDASEVKSEATEEEKATSDK
jgi:sec-independent protein translocase protein TatA